MRLRFTDGAFAGQEIDVTAERYTIGRAEGDDLRIPEEDLRTSRRHAELVRDDGHWVIRDLHSRNGVWVDGRRIDGQATLLPGQDVRIGSQRFQLVPEPRAGATVVYGGRRWQLMLEGLTIGRDRGNDLVLTGEFVSRHHARIDPTPDGASVTDLGSRNGVYLNGERVVGETRRLASGDTLRIGQETIRFLAGPQETWLAAAAPGATQDRVVACAPGHRLTIGRDAHNDVVLDEPNISRFHAEIVPVGDGFELHDLDSRNGTRLDGELVTHAPLRTGSQIGIGPFRLTFDGVAFHARDERSALRVDAHEVSVRAGGKTILEPTSVSIEPGEFVAIIGEAGSGKSTLLKRLAGVEHPATGVVTLNGDPVTTRLPEIGYVPQFEILHRGLTSREALTYSARLRLPADTSEGEIHEAVAGVIEELNISEYADRIIGPPERGISGGQRKRASVGAELVGRPGILFLDEPTSGLDAHSARLMMQTLRGLADGGRSVVSVLHREDLEICDKVIVIGRGGVLCFVGPPAAMLEHFGVPTYEEVFAALSGADPHEWQERWRTSEFVPPSAGASGFHAAPAPPRPAERGDFLRHARILSARAVRLLVRDRRNLLILFAQVPLLSLALLKLVEPGALEPAGNPLDGSTLLFLTVILAMWFGTFSAGREIVKEREVFLRESAVGVRVGSYLLAKCAVLFGLVSVQVAIMLAIVFPARPGAANATVIAFVVLSGLLGVAIGLLISACVGNENQAATVLLPAVLPQLLFAGSVVSATQLGAITYPFFSRWAFQGTLTAANFRPRFDGFQGSPSERKYIPFTDDVLRWPVAAPFGILVLSLAGLLVLIAIRLRSQVPGVARSRRAGRTSRV